MYVDRLIPSAWDDSKLSSSPREEKDGVPTRPHMKCAWGKVSLENRHTMLGGWRGRP